jgi:hypothetical protein
MKHILSFDIAKGKSIYCFIDELKNIIIDATLIEHNKMMFIFFIIVPLYIYLLCLKTHFLIHSIFLLLMLQI